MATSANGAFAPTATAHAWISIVGCTRYNKAASFASGAHAQYEAAVYLKNKALLFFENSLQQAVTTAKLSNRFVLCIEAGRSSSSTLTLRSSTTDLWRCIVNSRAGRGLDVSARAAQSPVRKEIGQWSRSIDV